MCVKNPPRKGRVFCRPGPDGAENGIVTPDEADEPVAIPISGELDLHTFQPAEVPRLLEDYFAACRLRGIRRVRVVHGKGTGTLRELVHARLRRSPLVLGFALAGESAGGWGATIVTLLPPDSC